MSQNPTPIILMDFIGSIQQGTSSNPLRIDPTGTTTQPVNIVGGSVEATNPSVGATGTTAPTSATEVGFISSGNLVGVSSSNPMPCTFTGSAGNAAASATGSAVPADADYLGFNSSGNLVGVSSGNPLPVTVGNTVAVTGTFYQATQPVSGTFYQTTQPVSLASVPALASGSNTIGAVTQASGPWTINLTQLNSVALGSPSNYGTSPGAVNVPGVNAYITNTPAVTQSGTWTVGVSASQTIAVTQATASSLNATVVQATGSNLHTVVDSGTITTVSTVTAVTSITNALPSGTNTIGNTGSIPLTSGGLSPKLLTSLTNSGQTVKSSAGQIYGWFLDNTENSGATTYFQFYNTSSPTVGSTTPVFSIPVPGGSAANVFCNQGIAFGTAIAIAATTTVTGGTAPGTSVTANIFYF